MQIKPSCPRLQQHIDHFWVVNNASQLFDGLGPISAFKGLNPELIIPLGGTFTYQYQGRQHTCDRPILFGFIHDTVHFDPSQLDGFIIVNFRKKGLASLLPFLNIDPNTFIEAPICLAEHVFNLTFSSLQPTLKGRKTLSKIDILEDYFKKIYRPEKEGFLLDLTMSGVSFPSFQTIRTLTNYSTSTLERYFKKETGLTPKKFCDLFRFRKILNEIQDTQNQDWLHYVEHYNFFDQSHFINNFKKHSGLTPSQHLHQTSLYPLRNMK